MAGVSEAPDVTVARVGAERDVAPRAPASGRHAWLSVGIAAWLVGTLYLLLWSIAQGLSPDPPLSVYIVPFYMGLAVLAAASIALIVRATRSGRRWRDALPTGYGVLGVGLAAVLAGFVADVGWREGVGQLDGIAGLLAPTRLLIVAGLAFVALAPLRAASRQTSAAVSGAPRWAAVLSAALLLAVLWLPGGFAPAVHLERAKVRPNSEIWLMDADGANQTRLIEAHDGAMAWNPVWSPDGTRLAYTRLVLGSRPPVDIPDEADIWVANADGTDAHALVARPDWQWIPHWSPDGAWIVYTDEPEAGPWADAGPAGLGGGGILGTGFGFGSPDPVRTYADIWRVRADGTGSPERITSDPGDDRAATFSPDGTLLAFDSTRAHGTDVWVMRADGSDPRQLTFDHGFTWGAAWSPDGSSIAFNAWRKFEEGFNQDLYRIDPEGRNETRLTQNPDPELEPSWSPDGKRIVFRRMTDDDGGEIVSIDANGNDEQLLSRAAGSADDLTSGGGVWAPDGRIVFMRGDNPPADAHPLVREDLATAALLITAIVLAFVATLLASINPPFGAFAVLIGAPTALVSTAADQMRFIPGAIVGGLLVDILVRFAPDRWKLVAAGAGAAAAYVVSAEVSVALTSGMGWSASLMSGVVVAVAAVGWGIAEVVRRPQGITPAGSA